MGDSEVCGPNRDSVASKILVLVPLMKRTTFHRRAKSVSAFRRMVTALLIAAYVIVGFGGEVSCAQESLTDGLSLEASVASDRPAEGPRKTATVVDHCYTCAPVIIPAPVFVAGPPAKPVKLSAEAPMFLLEDHPGLDTPPPKHLT